MSGHIADKQIEEYGKNKLAPHEKAKLVIHLANCEACYANFKKEFPAMTNQQQVISLAVFESEDNDESFHLNFEEHFRPFVDNEISEIDREIVESHIKICTFCASTVRELNELRDTLRLRVILAEQKMPGIWQKFMTFLNQPFRSLALALSLLIAVGLGIILWLTSMSRTEMTVDTSSVSEPSPIITDNSSANLKANDNLNVDISNSTSLTQVKPNENKIANNAEDKIKTDANDEASNTLAGLSGSMRELVNRSIQTEHLEFPSFMAVIAPGKLIIRGTQTPREIRKIAPYGEVLRETRPVFSWQKNDGENIVEIFDEKYNPIKQSPVIDKNEWQPEKDLPRGQILHWRITSKNLEAGKGSFYILDGKAERKVAQIKQNKQISGLARAIVLANSGLLKEAERELGLYIAKNPKSKTAQKFLNQIINHPSHKQN